MLDNFRTGSAATGDLAVALKLLEQLRPAIESADPAAQVDIAAQLVALSAPLGPQWHQLANLCAGNGELSLARRAIELFVVALGGTASAEYQRATALFEWGLLSEADAVLRGLPADAPDPLANAYSRGMMASYLGRAEEARGYLERVVTARPQSGTAWSTLAAMTDFAADTALGERLAAAEHDIAKGLPSERAAFFYARGKALADCAQHASAFAAFARGAREMRALAPHDRDADGRLAAEATQGYDNQRIAALASRQSERTDRTIFVAGAARSGTTLVQQILTNHSAVAGGGELSRLSLLAAEVGGQSYSAVSDYVARRGAPAAARLWHHWLDERFDSPGRIVDKSLDSSRYLGLAATLLPQAPVVWTTRDPLDRAWSCFSTHFFAGALPWSYDQEDIAAQFHRDDRLLGHWLPVLGERILVVPYEGLVAQPGAWIPRILAHCGLAEEPQVFSPQDSGHAVITASALQVRRPINQRAIGASQPYREFLGDFTKPYFS